MKYTFVAFCILLLLLAVLSGCTRDGHVLSAAPSAVQGVLDAGKWNFTNQGVLKLRGEWDFYWHRLLAPADLPVNQQQKGALQLPGTWNGYSASGHTLSGEGYATFVLKVNVNPEEIGTPKALYMPTASTAYTLFIDGKKVASNGVVGKSKADMQPQYLPQVVYFQPQNGTVEIVLQVSNFMHRKGGIWKDILFGDEKQITKKREAKFAFDMFFVSSLFIMGFYHFSLYLFLRMDKSLLYFGFFCIITGIRALLVGEVILVSFFPNFPWDIGLRIEYLAFYLSMPLFILFIYSLYPDEVKEMMVRLAKWTFIIFAIPVLLLPPAIYTWFILAFYLLVGYGIFYMIYVLMKVLLHKRKLALLNVTGGLMYLLMGVNDIFYYLGWVNTGDLTPFGLVFFILIHSVTLAHKFSKAFSTVESMSVELLELNNTLEKRVEERTKTLEYSLQEMAEARAQMSALEERNRIAGEIHDIVGHTLTTTIVQIEAGKRLIARDIPLALEKLELSQDLVRKGLNEIRQSVRMIKEEESGFELLPSVLQLIQETEKHTGARINYELLPLPGLPVSHKKVIYHALQEGLTNGLRHGQSTQFRFMLRPMDNAVFFLLEDNGVGCENIVYGFGLTAMRKRVKELDGTLEITTTKGAGYQLYIRIPF
ncbi:Sensor histidine kinase DesK [compost metagenome]